MSVFIFGFLSVAIVCMTYEDNNTDTQMTPENLEFVQEDPIRQYVLSWLSPGNHNDDDCDGEIGEDVDEVNKKHQ